MKDSPLKVAREQSGKTQAQVAKEIGKAINAYQQYEYGNTIPNAKLGNRISKALNTTSEKLWDY